MELRIFHLQSSRPSLSEPARARALTSTFETAKAAVQSGEKLKSGMEVGGRDAARQGRRGRLGSSDEVMSTITRSILNWSNHIGNR